MSAERIAQLERQVILERQNAWAGVAKQRDQKRKWAKAWKVAAKDWHSIANTRNRIRDSIAILTRERDEARADAEQQNRKRWANHEQVIALRAEVERLRTVLMEIADDACVWPDEYTGKSSPTCMCGTCTAKRALRGEETP